MSERSSGMEASSPFRLSMTTTRASRRSTPLRTPWMNSPGESCAGSTCWSVMRPPSTWDAQGGGRAHPRERGTWCPAHRRGRPSRGARGRPRSSRTGSPTMDFPAPAGPISSALVPRSEASAQQGVELGHAAPDDSTVAGLAMLRRDHAGEHPHAAGDDPEVVVPASKVEAAELGDPEPSPPGAELGGELLEPDDTMRDAVQLEIAAVRGAVIEEQHGAPPADEELLQGQDLPPVAERARARAGESRTGSRTPPALGLLALHLVEHRARGLAELHLGGVEDGVLVIRARRLGRRSRARGGPRHRATSRATAPPREARRSFPRA